MEGAIPIGGPGDSLIETEHGCPTQLSAGLVCVQATGFLAGRGGIFRAETYFSSSPMLDKCFCKYTDSIDVFVIGAKVPRAGVGLPRFV